MSLFSLFLAHIIKIIIKKHNISNNNAQHNVIGRYVNLNFKSYRNTGCGDYSCTL